MVVSQLQSNADAPTATTRVRYPLSAEEEGIDDAPPGPAQADGSLHTAIAIQQPRGSEGSPSGVEHGLAIEADTLDRMPLGQKEKDEERTLVQLAGVPASMREKLVHELLERHGGPLKKLSLSMDSKTQRHIGHGFAEFMDATSAQRASHASPLLGVITVKLAEGEIQEVGTLAPPSIVRGTSSPARSRKSLLPSRMWDHHPCEHQ